MPDEPMPGDPGLETLRAMGRGESPPGHRAIPLSDPDRIWLVESGRLEVFYQPAGAGGRNGGRHFLFPVEPGELALGAPPGLLPPGAELFALGVDARIIEIPRERFERWAAADEHRVSACALLDGWIAGVGSALEDEPPPSRFRPLDESTVTLAQGDTAFPREGVRWVRAEEGRVSVCARDEAELPRGRWIGVSHAFWIRALEPGVRLETASSLDLMARGELAAGIASTTALAFQCMDGDVRLRAEAEGRRIATQGLEDARAVGLAVGRLSSVLDSAEHKDDFEDLDPDDPLLSACQLVGRALDVEMRRPTSVRYGRRPPDDVSAIAIASRVRMRVVLLRDAWWNQDAGPLLAFRGEERRPVALIPARPGAYELLDPASRLRISVTPEVAAELKPTAHMFIAPFQGEAVTGRMLLKLGMKGIRGSAGILAFAGLMAAILGLVTPLVSKVLFDSVIPLADRPQLYALAGVMVILAVVAALLELLRALATLRVEAAMELRIGAALMDRLLRLPASFFKRFSAGDLANRALGVNRIQRVVTGATLASLLAGLFSLVNLFVLLVLDARLALLGAGLGVVALAAVALSSHHALRAMRVTTEIQGQITGLLFQFLSGISKLRVAGAERRAFGVWAGGFAEQRRTAYRAGEIGNHFQVFNAAFPVVANIIIFAVIFLLTGRALLAGGEMPVSTGDFVAIVTAFAQFLGGVLGMGLALLAVLEVVPLWERSQPIIRQTPEVRPDSRDPGELRGEIEVAHVSFRYSSDGPLVLDDVSIRVAPGEMVALVGPSGSGKSTLYRLLLGMESPDAGTIYFDGQDLATLDVDAVRRQIGVVLQNGRLVPASVLENIIGGSTHLSLEDAWEAARMAGLAEDIEAMPMSMHTMVSEGASTFSGGQRQRLMIARALVHRPRILFLDEATSALDNRTQEIVTESLERLRVARVVIAHRLSTIMGADRIYVLRDGRVVEEGSYSALMELDGAFAALARRQLVEA